jgi:hypothetical protein
MSNARSVIWPALVAGQAAGRRVADLVAGRAALYGLATGEWRWLAGAIVFGGLLLGPVLLVFGLTHTDAGAASLMLNLGGAHGRAGLGDLQGKRRPPHRAWDAAHRRGRRGTRLARRQQRVPGLDRPSGHRRRLLVLGTSTTT